VVESESLMGRGEQPEEDMLYLGSTAPSRALALLSAQHPQTDLACSHPLLQARIVIAG
jgi:hypothetical protein